MDHSEEQYYNGQHIFEKTIDNKNKQEESKDFLGSHLKAERSYSVIHKQFWPQARIVEGKYGRYEFIEKIAEGGMGITYRIKNIHWNKKSCVVKVPKNFRSETTFIKEILTWLDIPFHPRIITPYILEKFNGIPHLFIEEAQKGSLKDYLEKKKNLTLKEILIIGIQICECIKIPHELGLVHRDLKPANLLIGKINEDTEIVNETQDIDFSIYRIQLTDLGLMAKKTTDISRIGDTTPFKNHQTKVEQENQSEHSMRESIITENYTYSVMGTPEYMSQEQLFNSDCLDERADIYSLGVILYEMVTRELPLKSRERTFEAFRALHLSQQTTNNLNEIDNNSLRKCIQKCLHKDFLQRYPSVEEVRKELLDIYIQEYGEVYPYEQHESTENWSLIQRNNRALILLELKEETKGLELLHEARTFGNSEINIANFNWHLCWLRRGRFTLEEFFRETEKYAIKNVKFSLARIKICSEYGDLNKMQQELENALSHYPKNNELKLLSALLNYRQQNWESCQKIIEQIPFDSLGEIDWAIWGNTYWKQGEQTQARSVWQKGLTHFSTSQILTSLPEIPNDDNFTGARLEQVVELQNKIQLDRCFTVTHSHKYAINQNFDRQIINLQTGEIYTFGKWGTYEKIRSNRHDTYIFEVTSDDKFLVDIAYSSIKIWELPHHENNYAIPENSICKITDRRKAYEKYCITDSLLILAHENKIELWNIKKGKEVKVLEAHEVEIKNIALSPDKNILISGDQNGNIIIWDLHLGQCKTKIRIETGIEWIIFTPDNSKILVKDSSSQLHIWDICNEQEVFLNTISHREPVYHLRITRDSKYLITTESYKCNVVKIWCLGSGQIKNKITVPEHREKPILNMLITPDKKLILSHINKSIYIFDLEDSTLLYELVGHRKAPDKLIYITNKNYFISFQKNDNGFDFSEKDNSIKVWDIEKGVCIASIQDDSRHKLPFIVTSFLYAAYTQSNPLEELDKISRIKIEQELYYTKSDLLVALPKSFLEEKAKEVQWKQVKQNTLNSMASGNFDSLFYLYGEIQQLELYKQDYSLDKYIGPLPLFRNVFNVKEVSERHELSFSLIKITSSIDKNKALVKKDEFIHLLDISSGNICCTFSNIRFHPEHFPPLEVLNNLAITYVRQEEVEKDKTIIFDISKQQNLYEFQGRFISRESISLKNSHDVISFDNGGAYFLNLATGKRIHFLFPEGYAFALTSDHANIIHGAENGCLTICSLKQGKTEVIGCHKQEIVAVVSGKNKTVSSDRETIKIWNHKACSHIKTLKGNARKILLANNEYYFVSIPGSEEDEIIIWDLHKQKVINRIEERIQFGIITPDSQFFIGVVFRTIYFYRLENGEKIYTISLQEHVSNIEITEDMRFLVGQVKSKIKIWQIDWQYSNDHNQNDLHNQTIVEQNKYLLTKFSEEQNWLSVYETTRENLYLQPNQSIHHWNMVCCLIKLIEPDNSKVVSNLIQAHLQASVQLSPKWKEPQVLLAEIEEQKDLTFLTTENLRFELGKQTQLEKDVSTQLCYWKKYLTKIEENIRKKLSFFAIFGPVGSGHKFLLSYLKECYNYPYYEIKPGSAFADLQKSLAQQIAEKYEITCVYSNKNEWLQQVLEKLINSKLNAVLLIEDLELWDNNSENYKKIWNLLQKTGSGITFIVSGEKCYSKKDIELKNCDEEQTTSYALSKLEQYPHLLHLYQNKSLQRELFKITNGNPEYIDIIINSSLQQASFVNLPSRNWIKNLLGNKQANFFSCNLAIGLENLYQYYLRKYDLELAVLAFLKKEIPQQHWSSITENNLEILFFSQIVDVAKNQEIVTYKKRPHSFWNYCTKNFTSETLVKAHKKICEYVSDSYFDDEWKKHYNYEHLCQHYYEIGVLTNNFDLLFCLISPKRRWEKLQFFVNDWSFLSKDLYYGIQACQTLQGEELIRLVQYSYIFALAVTDMRPEGCFEETLIGLEQFDLYLDFARYRLSLFVSDHTKVAMKFYENKNFAKANSVIWEAFHYAMKLEDGEDEWEYQKTNAMREIAQAWLRKGKKKLAWQLADVIKIDNRNDEEEEKVDNLSRESIEEELRHSLFKDTYNKQMDFLRAAHDFFSIGSSEDSLIYLKKAFVLPKSTSYYLETVYFYNIQENLSYLSMLPFFTQDLGQIAEQNSHILDHPSILNQIQTFTYSFFHYVPSFTNFWGDVPVSAEELLQSLESPERDANVKALYTLSKLTMEAEKCLPQVITHLNSTDKELKTRSIYCLEAMGVNAKKSIDDLLKIIENHNEEIGVRVDAVFAVAEIEPENLEVIRQIQNIYEFESGNFKLALAYCIYKMSGHFPNPDILEKSLLSEDENELYLASFISSKLNYRYQKEEILVKNLNHSNKNIRGLSILALGKTKISKTTTSTLIDILNDYEELEAIKQTVLSVIVNSKDNTESIVEPLLTLAKDKEQPLIIRCHALIIIGELNFRNAKILQVLETTLQQEDNVLQVGAIYSLYHLYREEPVWEILKNNLQNEEDSIRIITSYCLTTIIDFPQEILYNLIYATTDENEIVRYNVTFALGHMKEKAEVALPHLSHLIRDRSLQVRKNAISTIGKLGRKAQFFIKEIQHLCSESHRSIKFRSLIALTRIDMNSPQSKTIFQKAIESKDLEIKMVAKYAMSILGKDKSIDVLKECLNLKSIDIRLFALEIFEEFGKNNEVDRVLKETLSDPCPSVYLKAERILRRRTEQAFS